MTSGRPARTKHGDYGYSRTNDCRCDLCKVGVRRYEKRIAYEKLQGISRRADATEAKAHVQRLVDAGATFGQIARATGMVVQEVQVRRLILGNRGKPVTWVYRHTAAALLIVTLDQALAFDTALPSIGVHRRLNALRYMGHSVAAISIELGITEEAVWQYYRRKKLMTTTIRKVTDLYDKWSMTIGDSERARWHAYRFDYAPPMAWEDVDIDDPDAEPDRSCIVCIVERCHRQVSRCSLCRTHLRRVLETKGFRGDSENFRLIVQRLNRQASHRQADHSLAELKEMGVTAEEAAARVGLSTEVVQKKWVTT